MAVLLSASYLQTSFQLLLNLYQMSQGETSDRAENVIYEWDRLKFLKILSSMPMRRHLTISAIGMKLA